MDNNAIKIAIASLCASAALCFLLWCERKQTQKLSVMVSHERLGRTTAERKLRESIQTKQVVFLFFTV